MQVAQPATVQGCAQYCVRYELGEEVLFVNQVQR